MKAGDTIELYAHLTDSVGADLSYADYAAFTAASWDLVFTIDQVVTTPTYTVADQGGGLHKFTLTAAEGDYVVIPTIPGSNESSVDVWQFTVDSVELSDVYAAVNSGGDLTAISDTLSDVALGNIVHGDAWGSGTITVPVARLAKIGLSDLSGCTISAAFRQDPSTTPVSITATIESAANREISVGFDTFPVAMALGTAATDLSATWYLDIQIKHTSSGKILTVGRYSVQVIWQRDETT